MISLPLETSLQDRQCHALCTLSKTLKCWLNGYMINVILCKHQIITIRNEVAKVMFLQACVCPQGGCLPQCMVGYTPLEQTSPISRHPPPEQTPHGADTPPQSRPPGSTLPPEQTPPQQQTPPGSRYPPEQIPPPGSRHPPRSRHPPPPRETATAADGTHSTGMHSCINCESNGIR